ncbi:MAG: hypothetical protein KDA65_18350 [Planctomycetaceae bacterium]|nr:hypothetical protein [Planctomycetaceae bacterium]
MDVILKRFNRNNRLAFPTLLICLAMITGCGTGTGPNVPPADNAPTQPVFTVENTVTEVVAEVEHSQNDNGLPDGVSVDESGNKQLDDIPYDIWFEKPLALVKPEDLRIQESTGLAAASNSTAVPSTTGQPPELNSTAPNKNPSADDWGSVISPTQLEEEVTRISISLGSYLNQLGSYNRSLGEISEESEALIATALVASQVNETFRWKEQAFVLADCGARLVAQSAEAGRASFKAAQVPLQQIHSVLNGEAVSLDHELDQSVKFSERVDRGAIMYRMESAFDWLAKNIDSEGKLKSEQKVAEREAAILAMLGKIIDSPGYPSTEESGYHEQAAGFFTTAAEMKTAIQSENFNQFRTHLDRLEKHCSDCHADYRFE